FCTRTEDRSQFRFQFLDLFGNGDRSLELVNRWGSGHRLKTTEAMTAVSQMYNFTQMSQMRVALRGANHIIARMPTKKAPAKKAPAAFLKPVQPDEALAKIVGSKPLPRTDLTKKLWDYIKKNKLQDAKKKTQINADDALKAVFNGKKSVSMFEMTKLVSGHLEK